MRSALTVSPATLSLCGPVLLREFALAAAFARAAVEIDAGAEPAEVRQAVLWLLQQTLPA